MIAPNTRYDKIDGFAEGRGCFHSFAITNLLIFHLFAVIVEEGPARPFNNETSNCGYEGGDNSDVEVRKYWPSVWRFLVLSKHPISQMIKF